MNFRKRFKLLKGSSYSKKKREIVLQVVFNFIKPNVKETHRQSVQFPNFHVCAPINEVMEKQ